MNGKCIPGLACCLRPPHPRPHPHLPPLSPPSPSVLPPTPPPPPPPLPRLISAHSNAHFHSLVVQGVRRPSLPDYLEVKRCFAVHECGKALVAIKLREKTGRLEQVERVSIVPRGRSAAPCCPLTPSCPTPHPRPNPHLSPPLS